MEKKEDNLEQLLNALRGIKSTRSKIQNTKDVWSLVGSGKWSEAGFSSESEMSAWLEQNEYGNLS